MKVNTDRPRSRRKVQEHLLEASHDIISTAGSDVNSSDDEPLAAVRYLFEGMEKQGVRIVKADKGSILFTILCPTIKSLINLTHYLKSPEIQSKLSYIETTVNKCHNCVANIAIDVDLNSLHSAVKELETVLDNGTVYLTLECDGVAGVKNAFHTFGHNESTNTLLSEALSHTLGEQVEIQTDIDIDKMKGTTEKNNKENKLREKEMHLSKEGSKEKDQEMQTLEKDSLKQEQTRNLYEEVHRLLDVSGLQQEGKQAIPKTDFSWIKEPLEEIYMYQPIMASERYMSSFQRLTFETQLQQTKENLQRLKTKLLWHEEQYVKSFQLRNAPEWDNYWLRKYEFTEQLERSNQLLNKLKSSILMYETEVEQEPQSSILMYETEVEQEPQTELFREADQLERSLRRLKELETDLLRQEEQLETLLLQLKVSQAEDPVSSWAKDRKETIRDLRRLGEDLRYQASNANISRTMAGGTFVVASIGAAASFLSAPVTSGWGLLPGVVLSWFAVSSYQSFYHREMLCRKCTESIDKDRKSFKKLKKATENTKKLLNSETGKALPDEIRLVEIFVACRLDVSEKAAASLLKLEQKARFASHATVVVALALDIECFIKDIINLAKRDVSAVADKVFELADQLRKEYDEIIADTA